MDYSKLTDLLHELNVTQAELSEATGISQPYISKILKGGVMIKIETLQRIADGINMPMDELIKRVF